MATIGGYNVVTAGLVLSLDAANRRSYVSGSSTWFDVSGNRNSGSLVNGPGFDSANAGSIVFDGLDDYAQLSSNITISSDWTIITWIQSNQTASSAAYIRLIGTNEADRNFFFFEFNNRILSRNSLGNSFAFQSGWTPGLPLDRSFFMLTVMGRASNLEVYQNTTQTTVNTPLTGSLTFNRIMTERNSFPPGGKISTFLIYNRALSAAEITQNYNASKGRFGL